MAMKIFEGTRQEVMEQVNKMGQNVPIFATQTHMVWEPEQKRMMYSAIVYFRDADDKR